MAIVTLFHKANSPASTRVATLLRQEAAIASETATEDQASDHTAQSKNARQAEFDLDITEEPPTHDQLKTILEYVGKTGIPYVVKGANTESEALRKFKESASNFQRPVVRIHLCCNPLFAPKFVYTVPC